MESSSIDVAGPEQVPAVLRWKGALRSALCDLLLPLMQRAARPWASGETVGDALAVAARLAEQELSCTLGLWGVEATHGRPTADAYLAAIGYLQASELSGYLSIKSPDLAYDRELSLEVARGAAGTGVCLHFDSHGPEDVDETRALLELMLRELPGTQLGTTLPGRWRRSREDAAWAIERGLQVRVVKGQWAEAGHTCCLRAGFLEMIDHLAGRARHVGVASHDVPLAAQAIGRLRDAGTSCALELLFGLPMEPSLSWARANGVPVRVYVPYGRGFLPQALSQLRRNPRILWWILKDVLLRR